MKYKIVDIERGVREKESRGDTYKYKKVKIEIGGVVREFQMSVGYLKSDMKFEVVEIQNGMKLASDDDELYDYLYDYFFEDIANELEL